jgi:mannitol/fructose-specific phosphotransferase system IIA component (Ntr-type)
MVIADLAHPDLVDADIRCPTKEAFFSKIVDFLCEKGRLHDKNEALQALLDREKNGSTGIGNGVAVPHARLVKLTEVILYVGISKQGIDFSSVDRKPAKIIVLLLSPVSDIGTSLKILANIARMINDRYFTDQLLRVSTDDELYSVLKQSSHDRQTSYALKDHA